MEREAAWECTVCVVRWADRGEGREGPWEGGDFLQIKGTQKVVSINPFSPIPIFPRGMDGP